MSEPVDGMTCPHCGAELVREICNGGSQPTCPTCSGRAITVAMLRRFAPLDAVREVWRLAVIEGEASSRACPACTRPMTAGHVRVHPVEPVEPVERVEPVEHAPIKIKIEIEGCRGCQLLWFDTDELEAVSPDSQQPRPHEPDAMAEEHERWMAHQRDQSRRELVRRLEEGGLARLYWSIPY